MSTPPLAQALNEALSRYPQLDANAVRAVASMEGLGGGIGDGGHAFGPFQLNNAGGVITGRFPGQSPEQINRWAWTPEGIRYALEGIARVASGQHGAQAINSIVSRFERPANIPREIAGATAAYGGLPQTPVAALLPQGIGTVAPPVAAQAPVAPVAPLAAQLPTRPRNDAGINMLLALASGRTPSFSNILASIR